MHVAPASDSYLWGRRAGARVGRPGEQRYVDATSPVLVTRLTDADSAYEITDHIRNGRIVRVLTGLRGCSSVALSVDPAEAFGPPRKIHRWSNGIAFGSLRVEGAPVDEPFDLLPGERRVVTISVSSERQITRSGPGLEPLTLNAAMRSQAAVQHESRLALDRLAISGPYRAMGLRSARILRMLTNPSNGALVRSLTTSLPARLGNERNIDERFAWLRDNADAIRIWERLEQWEWAANTRTWLADRCTDEFPLAPAYRASGERLPSEEELGLLGWDGNRPVRLGNRVSLATDIGAIAQASMMLDAKANWPTLERLGDWLAESAIRRQAGSESGRAERTSSTGQEALGMRADHGRWDSRTKPIQNVESALAVRIALESLIATARRNNPLDPVVVGWRESLRSLNKWLEVEGHFGRRPTDGWRRAGGAAADDSSDASLLRWMFDDAPGLPSDDEHDAANRRTTTLDQTLAQLGEGPFLYRHLPHVTDGFPPGQGVDLWASFAAVTVLARCDRWEEAHSRMEALESFLGPLHVGSTHADPLTGDLRGNFAAAPVHIACIEATLALASGPR